MSNAVIVLDAGALDQATTNREFRLVLRALLEDGWDAVIPTVVLAEAITGGPRDAPTNQTINRLGTEVTDEASARRAGALRSAVERSSARRLPSAIDAIVAAHAGSYGRGVVFTSDPGDLRRLLASHPTVHVTRP